MSSTFSDRRRLAGAACAAAAGLFSLPLVAQPAKAPTAPVRVVPQAPAAADYPIIVLNSRDADVSLIHPRTHAVLGRVPTGKEPHHLYPTPDNRHVIVGNAVSDSLTVLDPLTGRVVANYPGVADPYHLGFSPDQAFFVTCANRLDHVDIYRSEPIKGADGQHQFHLRGVARFDLAKTPSHLVFSGDSGIVYCTLQESDEVVAIDLRKLAVLWRIKVGRLPAGIAISPDSRLLFVGCMGTKVVQVIDLAAKPSAPPRVVQSITTGDGAHAFRNHGNKRHLWVSNRVANTISRIDMSTLKVDAQIDVPGGPDCMDVHASGKQVWVTQRWIRSVALVDLDQSRVVKTIGVGRSPHGVYLHDRAELL
jgi:YVTN family beta-propeller protein